MSITKYFKRPTLFMAFLILCVSDVVMAANPLSLETDGLDGETKDPIKFADQLIAVIGTFVLGVMGFIFLVTFIQELTKGYAEAKEDGKWWKLGTIFIVGILILLVIVYLISLGIGVLA